MVGGICRVVGVSEGALDGKEVGAFKGVDVGIRVGAKVSMVFPSTTLHVADPITLDETGHSSHFV
jgi:hypothetical protein